MALALALGLAPAVHAASVTYAMQQSNALADGVTWATVTIEDVGSDVRFTVATVPQSAYYTPGPNFGLQLFGFNFAGNGTLAPANLVLPGGWSLATNRNVGGFGRFEYVISSTGSRNDPLQFVVQNVSGDTIASYFDLSTGNAGEGNSPYVAHLAGFASSRCVGADGAAISCVSAYLGGAVAPDPNAIPPAVPLPATVWLLGSALLGLCGLRRRSPSRP